MNFVKEKCGSVYSLWQEDAKLNYMAEFLLSLSADQSLLIASKLQDSDLTVTEICSATGLVYVQVASSLAMMRRSGVVAAHRRGIDVFYGLQDTRINNVIALAEELGERTIERRAS